MPGLGLRDWSFRRAWRFYGSGRKVEGLKFEKLVFKVCVVFRWGFFQIFKWLHMLEAQSFMVLKLLPSTSKLPQYFLDTWWRVFLWGGLESGPLFLEQTFVRWLGKWFPTWERTWLRISLAAGLTWQHRAALAAGHLEEKIPATCLSHKKSSPSV